MNIDKPIKGLILTVTGICLITGGVSLIHGVTGALVSSGIMISIWGMVLMND